MFRRLRATVFPREQTDLGRMERNARTHLLLSQLFWLPAWAGDYDPEDQPRVAARVVDILLAGLTTDGLPKSTMPPRRPVLAFSEGEVSLDAFLKAATELINEEGYRGASVSKISRRLNVTKGSFYHHNTAKDELVTACFDRTLEIMRRTQIAAEAQPRGLERVLSATATLIGSELSGEAPLLRTSALTSVPEAMRADLIKRFDRLSVRFASQLSDGVADGSVRPVDTRIAAHMITGAINAAAELHHWAPGSTAETAFDLYVRPMFAGLYVGATPPAEPAYS
jgi:AcrR family transcriptional regulator